MNLIVSKYIVSFFFSHSHGFNYIFVKIKFSILRERLEVYKQPIDAFTEIEYYYQTRVLHTTCQRVFYQIGRVFFITYSSEYAYELFLITWRVLRGYFFFFSFWKCLSRYRAIVQWASCVCAREDGKK